MRKQLLFLLFFMFSFGTQAAITTAAPPNGAVGVVYSHQMITMTPSLAPNYIYFWEVTGLPPGLSIGIQGANITSIVGTPTTPGTYTVLVTTHDADINGLVLDGPITYTIVIPGAVAANAASIPTLSEWGMIFLSSLIAMFGIAKVRRRNG